MSSTADFRLADITYYFRPSPSLSKTRQVDICRLLGGHDLKTITMIDEDSGLEKTVFEVIYKSTLSPDPGDPWNAPVYWMLNHKLYVDSLGSVAGATPSYITNGVDGINSVMIYPQQVSSITQSDFVYVRTTANAASYSANLGRKTDILAILPWNRDFGGNAQFENHIQTDIYSVAENINSVKTIEIKLTDEIG
jgi:hypothetical protein